MRLFRTFAYAVTPQRTAETFAAPLGGRVELRPPVRAALDAAAADASTKHALEFRLRVDTATRTSEVREAVIQLGFGTDAASEAAALQLASRLSRSMDARSEGGLFVATAARDGSESAERRVALWVFPSDEFFRLQTGDSIDIQLITDAFSRKSTQRKLAVFEGRRIHSHFLTGSALDLQARGEARGVAHYWLDEFLGAALELAPDLGSRLVADVFREASKQAISLDDKQRLTEAAIALRSTQRARWSINDVAEELLEGAAKEAFTTAARRVVSDEPSRRTSFDFRRATFDSSIGRLMYTLTNGVTVIAELGSATVRIDQDGDQRVLRVEGHVDDEKLRKGR